MAHYCAAGFVKDRNRQGDEPPMRNGVLGYYVHCVVTYRPTDIVRQRIKFRFSTSYVILSTGPFNFVLRLTFAMPSHQKYDK